MPRTKTPLARIVPVPVAPDDLETREEAAADRDRIGVWLQGVIKKSFTKGALLSTLAAICAVSGGVWALLNGGFGYAQTTGINKATQDATNKDLYSKYDWLKTDVKGLRTDMQAGFASAAQSLKATDDKVNDLRVTSGRIEQKLDDLRRKY
jgi:outer membrane murein-binding lipoprotein Lpp